MGLYSQTLNGSEYWVNSNFAAVSDACGGLRLRTCCITDEINAMIAQLSSLLLQQASQLNLAMHVHHPPETLNHALSPGFAT
ncbi:hypothetical protein [Nostoc sp. T09]|uniref:hypothetical protein n=1 Tax=Nostoc sp. T09 TaxID=1932621 RepID=UPI001180DE22|nr:hypothetical protein [Nostoc sp. T09]